MHHKEEERHSWVPKILIIHHLSGVTEPSGLQDKDLGAWFLLDAQNRGKSKVYKHKNEKELAKVQLKF